MVGRVGGESDLSRFGAGGAEAEGAGGGREEASRRGLETLLFSGISE